MNSHLGKKLLGIALLFFFTSVTAARADVYLYVTDKQKEKEPHRWSLAEWLDTRDRMRVMDLWLALHTPTPFEFYAAGDYSTGTLGSGGYFGGWDFTAAAYAYLFGLEVQRQMGTLDSRWFGLVDFRALGYHSQATNLTFQGGVKNETRNGASLWNPVVGATLTLYLFKNFGVEGLYRHAFSYAINGVSTANDRFQGGAFIDFSFVRVYGDYFSEVEAANPAYSSHGVMLGTRLYF
jgi:hypothetical protein